MTKEEIISEQLGMEYHSMTADQLSVYHVCMDEYAKQQAIDFDIWKLKNHWVWNNSICKYFKWDGDDLRETSLSHEEIYSRFIEQQTKEK